LEGLPVEFKISKVKWKILTNERNLKLIIKEKYKKEEGNGKTK